MSELRFDGRAVVVTGGGGGLGRHYALLLAARGAGVVIADYGVSLEGEGTSSEPAESVAAEINAAGGAAVACYASVSNAAGAATMVEAALDSFGRLDAVVNNAGIVDHAWMDELDEAQVRRLLDNHAIGTFLVTKAAWPHLVASDAGRVVNTVSESMLGNTPKAISYAAAKGAVFGLTRGMALDGRRHGVHVNAVAPRVDDACARPQGPGGGVRATRGVLRCRVLHRDAPRAGRPGRRLPRPSALRARR